MHSHAEPERIPHPIGILISQSALALVEGRVKAAADAAGRQVRFEVASEADALSEAIQIAFFSRDLWEGSDLDMPSPASARFFDLLASSPTIRWTHVCSAGADLPIYRRIPPQSCITMSPGAAARPIAQSVVATMLWKARQFPRWQSAQAQRLWNRTALVEAPPDLDRQTALVVGMGPIGLETGRLLRAIGMRTVGLSRSVKPSENFHVVAFYDAIDDHLPAADWLVLACPLTESIACILHRRRIALLPAGGTVINVGRGGLVDESALIEALAEKRLAGAYLDVFETEPLPRGSLLWDMPGVIVSPHGAGLTRGGPARVADLFVSNFERWIADQPLEHVFERLMA